MKKIFLTISAALLLCGSMLTAQTPTNRSVRTIVADVLAQLPANNQKSYNELMKDLAGTGEEGILALVNQLNAPGKGSNAAVEYALSGVTHYVSAQGKETERKTVVNAYKKALVTVTVNEIKSFLNEQLRMLGENEAPPAATEQPIPAVTKTSPVHQRIAALRQEIRQIADNKKSLNKKILNALKDPSIEYRCAALDFASAYAGEELYVELLKTAAKSKNTAVKVDVINWLGREAQCPDKKAKLSALETSLETTAVGDLIKLLASNDFDVLQATAGTLVSIGNVQAIPSLAGLLTNDDPQVIAVGQEALSTFKGEISSAVARIVSAAPDKGKIAAVQLLAQRKAVGNINTVLDLIKSGSPEVKTAAYTALKDVVGEKDLTLLFGMLESSDGQATAPLQQAVVSALSSLPAGLQAETIIRRIYQAGESKKHLYYLPLAVTKDDKAMDMITDGFAKGNKEVKDAAFEALLNWNGREAADKIFAVCKNPSASAYFDRALTAYVKLASDPALTGENRLIFLRKAMETAKTDAQKNDILKQIGKTGTYPALLYAGEFIGRSALKETAAQAVMDIALNNSEYTGENVVALLNLASAALSNPDADYQRQSIKKHLDEMPKEKGFVSIFNGKDLTGWKGLVENPIARTKMKPAQLAKAQIKADEQMRKDWVVEDGLLAFAGKGYDNLCTEKQYGDFEMYVDWMLDPAGPEADAGIYLRGTPQVQIWDTARTDVGAQVGSGGLYNNKVNQSKPSKVADNRLGEWNTMFIRMVGDRVTVKLNGELVVDDVILENYWDRNLPIPAIEQIELQAHGSKVYYRNIYVRELERPEPFQLSAEEKKDGFKILFDGTNMHEWTGNLVDYTLEDGCISMIPSRHFGGNLYTKEEYANFSFRFEFQLTPAANNGVGIRTPMEGDAAYVGMEIQILDCEHAVYKDIMPYQHHGSIYGVIAAEHGAMKPIGEWNTEEIYADGDHIRVTLNGKVILDGNIREAAKNGTIDHNEHPGLFNKGGHIAFLGHGSPLKFRNIRVKRLN
ncbi:MAG: DUF1080 domain-containing protein [Tannerella sp.]|jgi:HEAT repeat protein|nr:DUF1080 domain-containing protein [Tannerella sp.]